MLWQKQSTDFTKPKSFTEAAHGSPEAVELATLKWVDWFKNRRLLGPNGNIPPAEAEAMYYANLDKRPVAA